MQITRHVYTSPGEKRRDFIIGFVGWFIGNALLWGLIVLLANLLTRFFPNNPVADTLSGLLLLLPWLVNLAAIIVFALTRSQIALGILAAFGVVLGLVLLAGVVIGVLCFIQLQHS